MASSFGFLSANEAEGALAGPTETYSRIHPRELKLLGDVDLEGAFLIVDNIGLVHKPFAIALRTHPRSYFAMVRIEIAFPVHLDGDDERAALQETNDIPLTSFRIDAEQIDRPVIQFVETPAFHRERVFLPDMIVVVDLRGAIW